MRLLLWGTGVTVILGSGAHPILKDAAFYGRFLMYGLVAGYLLLRRGDAQRPLWYGGALTLLFATCVASTVWSVSPSLTLQRSLGFGLLLTAVALLARRRWTNLEILRADVVAVALAAVAAFAVSTLLLVKRDWAYSDIAYGGGLRFTGVFENPNEIGLLGAIVFPLLLALASTSKTHAFYWHAAGGTVLLAEALAQSRGGIIALAVAMVAFTLMRPAESRRSQAVTLTLLLTVLAPMFALSGGAGGVAESVAGRFEAEGLESGRFTAWGVAIDAWESRPVAGYGYGTGDQVFTPLVEHLADTNVFVGSNPHNAYLMALLEIGPVGLSLLLLIVIGALRRSFIGPRSNLRAGLAASLVAGLVVSIVESGATSAGSIFGFNFWLILAAASSAAALSVREQTPLESPRGASRR